MQKSPKQKPFDWWLPMSTNPGVSYIPKDINTQNEEKWTQQVLPILSVQLISAYVCFRLWECHQVAEYKYVIIDD